MKTTKNTVMYVSVLFMMAIWGFLFARKGGYIPEGLQLVIFLLIMLFGVYAFFINMRRHKDLLAGLPLDDEFTVLIKHQAGYYTFITSLYFWFGLFLVKDLVPDHDTLFGLGVLAPSVMFMVARSYLGRRFDENAN